MGCCKSKKAGVGSAELEHYNSFHEIQAPAPPPPATNEIDERFQTVQGEYATFGCGGDFKKAQARFALLPGIIRTRVGFSGGKVMLDKKLSMIHDHTEVVDIEFDPSVTPFVSLVQLFWQTHDPTKTHGKLFQVGPPDRRLEKKKGSKDSEEGKKRQYSVVFYHSKEQKEVAEEELARQDREIHSKNVLMAHVRTDVDPAKHVFPADMEDQQYYLHQDKFLFKLVNCSTSEELQYSHLASRLNGLCSEFANPEVLDVALTDLNLSDEVAAYLRTKVKYSNRKTSVS